MWVVPAAVGAYGPGEEDPRGDLHRRDGVQGERRINSI